jgi:hypothetical protein
MQNLSLTPLETLWGKSTYSKMKENDPQYLFQKQIKEDHEKQVNKMETNNTISQNYLQMYENVYPVFNGPYYKNNQRLDVAIKDPEVINYVIQNSNNPNERSDFVTSLIRNVMNGINNVERKIEAFTMQNNNNNDDLFLMVILFLLILLFIEKISSSRV